MTKRNTCVWWITVGYLGALAACSDGDGAESDDQTEGPTDVGGLEEGSRVNKGRSAALGTPNADSGVDPNASPAAGGMMGGTGGITGGMATTPDPASNGGSGGTTPGVPVAGTGGSAGSGVGGTAGAGAGGTGGAGAGGMTGSGGSSVSVPDTGGAPPVTPNITLMAKVIKTKLLVADVIYAKQIKLGVSRIGEMSEAKQERRYEMAKGGPDVEQPSVRANVIYAEDIEAEEVQAKQLFAQQIQYF